MAKDSAASPRQAARPARGAARSPSAAQAPRRGSAPRPVAAGDTAASLRGSAIEADRISRAATRAETVASMALSDVLAHQAPGGDGGPGEWLTRLRALVDGASPDEVKALRRVLFEREQGVTSGIDPDIELAPGWREGGYPYKNLMSRKNYEKQKYRLQVELLKLQAWVKESGQRVVILFEGRDAAGKGGTIKRFMEHLNPRGARVVALEKPSEVERGQWYFQRYIEHLPTRGEIVLFDRSWYNRAGVERAMGFCSQAEYDEFMRQCPEFERHLVRSGVHLFKFWFSVSRAEQRRRFKERQAHPLKQWKLSPIDMASLDKWDDYTRAKEQMFLHTDTSDAPWTVIKSDCKKRARLNAMRYLLLRLPYANKDLPLIGSVDPLLVGRAALVAGAAEEFTPSSNA
ncbi:MAG: polyphosphate kinase 2 [Rubrivivax sp.]|jgi:polyphosphate kinase 2|nr:polyphosphate kinase 2 [Rubrivivax sp.]